MALFCCRRRIKKVRQTTRRNEEEFGDSRGGQGEPKQRRVDHWFKHILSRKRMSVSRTGLDLTGEIQSAGAERQPDVEHLRCKEGRPVVPPCQFCAQSPQHMKPGEK